MLHLGLGVQQVLCRLAVHLVTELRFILQLLLIYQGSLAGDVLVRVHVIAQQPLRLQVFLSGLLIQALEVLHVLPGFLRPVSDHEFSQFLHHGICKIGRYNRILRGHSYRQQVGALLERRRDAF